MGNLEILEGKRRGNQKAALAVMATTLIRMSRMVDQLLASARLDLRENELHREEFAVVELLRESYDDCAVLTEERGVALSYKSDDAIISGDRDKLKEVVLNLVSNALKHTERGGTIALTATAKDAYAEVTVRDTGSGIAPKDTPHIFERFYRIYSNGPPGTGLGLHICQKIVRAHGGTITVESELYKGSQFTVSLPLLARPSKDKN